MIHWFQSFIQWFIDFFSQFNHCMTCQHQHITGKYHIFLFFNWWYFYWLPNYCNFWTATIESSWLVLKPVNFCLFVWYQLSYTRTENEYKFKYGLHLLVILNNSIDSISLKYWDHRFIVHLCNSVFKYTRCEMERFELAYTNFFSFFHRRLAGVYIPLKKRLDLTGLKKIR